MKIGEVRPCNNCGKPYTVKTGRHIYCSPKCAHIHQLRARDERINEQNEFLKELLEDEEIKSAMMNLGM